MGLFEKRNGNYHSNIKLNPFQSAVEKDFWDDDGEISRDKVVQYILMGGFANGKSFWTQLATHRMCMKYPGTKWLYIKSRQNALETTVIPQMLKDFAISSTYPFKYNKQRMRFEYTNGSMLHFKGYDLNNIHDILSSEWHGFSMNQVEEIHEEVYLMVIGRRRGQKDRKIPLLMEGNPAPGWVKRRFVDQPIDAFTRFYTATTFANMDNLPEDYIPMMERTYGKEKIARYMMGSFESQELKVFHTFNDYFNVVPSHEIDQDSTIIVGFDHGVVHASAFIYFGLNKKGEIHVFDEFFKTRASTHDLIGAAKKWGRVPIVADYAIKRHERDGRCLWDDLMNEGLRLVESNKDKMGNIRIVNDGFKNKKLFIHDNCENLIREINDYMWKLDKSGGVDKHCETPVKRNDDAVDAFMYGYRELIDKHAPKENEAHKRMARRFFESDNRTIQRNLS